MRNGKTCESPTPSRSKSPDPKSSQKKEIAPIKFSSQFSDNQDVSHMIKILSKQTKERTKYEIRYLASQFQEKYNFFKKLKANGENERIEALLSVINLEKHEDGSRIIKYGEEGDKFYIIIKGKTFAYCPQVIEKEMKAREYVHLLWKIKHYEMDEVKLKRYDDYNRNLINFGMAKNHNFNISHIGIDLDYKKTFKIEEEKKIGERNEGEEFGEVALVNKVPRMATMIAQGECLLAVLDKNDYNRILKQIEDKKNADLMQELRSHYLIFRNWGKKHLLKLIYNMKKVNMIFGHAVYEQNSPSDSIFLSIKGQFEVSCNVDINNHQSYIDFINAPNKNSMFKLFQTIKTQLPEKEFSELLEKYGKEWESYKHEVNNPKEFLLSQRTVDTKVNKLINMKLKENEITKKTNFMKIKVHAI